MLGTLPRFIYIQGVPRGICRTVGEGYMWQLTSRSRNIPRLHPKLKGYGEYDRRKIWSYFAVQSTDHV